MKVYTGSPYESGVVTTGRVAVLLRRVGWTVGLLFGFGLLALVMAGNASAEESQQDGDESRPSVDHSLLDVVDPVTRSVGDVLSQTVDSAAPVVEPLASVTRLADPVLEPVVDAVTPVLDAVAPVTEPLVGPLLHAVEPVTDPVTGALGVEDEVSDVADAVSGESQSGQDGQRIDASGTVVPQGLPLPLSPVVSGVEHSATVTSEPMVRSDSMTRAVSPDSPRAIDPGHPDPSPTVPVGPLNAVSGGSGSVGGSAGPHSADSLVSAIAGATPDDNSGGRGPPQAETSHPWLSYDQPDCPS